MRHPLALFDLDNTLVDRQGTLAEWAAGFVARHGLDTEEQSHLVGMVAARAHPPTFDAIRARYRLPPSATELWRAYCADIAALVSCPPEVLDGLDALRSAGWRVGVATNGASDIQRAKLRSTRILQHVNGVFVSGEVDVRKPRTRHFALAAARCGATLDDGGWMVGDSVVNDIGGGRTAGLRTVWVHNGRSWPNTSGHGPDHTVPDVRAAIDLLLHTTDHERTTA
ncbi:HAD family hydrolase [Streptomyces chumphonensis]|uniref:HAD family hydrolase n=1 Tax=Streptomyces chumphonensis TaxID=1214925 RepID=A0A927EXZ9_9ACTN|nr:HAD family hydrolase [Streptomyces chumphonensis]MBD3932050.1 HAD family hydrolase [Streptomyces chumphonensis]